MNSPSFIVVDIGSCGPSRVVEDAAHRHDHFEDLPENLRKREALIWTVFVVLIPARTESCEKRSYALVVCQSKAKSSANSTIRHQLDYVGHPAIYHGPQSRS